MCLFVFSDKRTKNKTKLLQARKKSHPKETGYSFRSPQPVEIQPTKISRRRSRKSFIEAQGLGRSSANELPK